MKNLPPYMQNLSHIGYVPIALILIVAILFIIFGWRFMKKENERSINSDVHGDHLPCCKSSATDLSETSAVICLILNVAYPGGGTVISSFIDRKGCNMTAFWTGVL